MPEYTLDDLLDLSRYVDDHGYYCISLGDGFLAKARWDPIITQTAIAMVTKRVKLATATLNINYRHPVQFARDWAVLDQISRGRTILGIGIGTAAAGTRGEEENPFTLQREMEIARNGHLYEKRGTMLAEWIELVKELWTKENVSYHGKCYNYDGLVLQPKPYQKPYPPVLMSAGYGTAKDFILKRVAKVADGWLVNGGTTPELFAPTWDRLKEYLKQNSKDHNKFDTAYQVTGTFGENVRECRQEMVWWIKSYYGTDDAERLNWWGPQGGADVWIDWITKCADAGIKTFIVRFATRKLREQLDAFTRQVLPSL
jgi:alkanesulfonate monooxygenase SsuD/methylene tetrahydromethanopterin reductase-like flavin-dependent oxidoreductase (luciferase family)